jgi:hypothetical protein
MSDPITYTLKRDAFGHPTNFKMKEETRPHELSIKSEPELERNFEQRNPKTITLTNITEKSCHMVKTDKTKMTTLEMRHIEGGWPDEVAHTKDPAQHKREIQVWKRRIGTSEEFSNKVKILIDKTGRILKQNRRLDIYEDHFENNDEEQIEDDYSAKTKSVFKYKRTVNQLAMYIEEDQSKVVKGIGRFAVTYKLCKGQDVPPTEKLPVIFINIVLYLGYK